MEPLRVDVMRSCKCPSRWPKWVGIPRGGHATQESGHFRAGLGESEDVVDEQQHVLPLGLAEILGNRQARQADAQPGAGRLGHLAVDQRGLVDNPRLFHFQPQVVAFAGALADAGEYREAAVFRGDVADELHDDDGLADPGAAEQAGLAALGVGFEQVDDLDAGLQHFGAGALFLQGGGLAVDGVALLHRHLAHTVYRLADDVEDAPEHLTAHRHRNRLPGVLRLGAAHQAVRGLHGHRAHGGLAQMLGDLGGDFLAVAVSAAPDLEGVVDGRQPVGRKLDVHHGADDLNDFSRAHALSLE